MNDIYSRLIEHQKRFAKHTLNELFTDKNRGKKYSVLFQDIYFDYSKNFLTAETLNLLFELAEKRNLRQKIEEMFAGKEINFTEKRSVLHTALRNFSNKPVFVGDEDIMPKILHVRSNMKDFVNRVISGEWKGVDNNRITDVVNIGIGGSHLGPEMVVKALSHYNTTDLKVHFVSNVDKDDLQEKLAILAPENTLFIISSKTFTTSETMTNAETAKKWFVDNCSSKFDDIAKHFIAISTNREKTAEFGIPEENMFEFWDWVGGRYSLWSTIGMSIALAVGWENFEELLRGGFEIDRHFRSSPFDMNIPVLMGLLTVWYATYWKFNSNSVIPYSHVLSRFPAFLQQLQMESNGKSVNFAGNEIEYETGQVIFGEAGTNSQHSFFQLLHQGTQTIPVDFIGFANAHFENDVHFKLLLSNMIAQAEALMIGKSREKAEEELVKLGIEQEEMMKLVNHRMFAGNKPSNTMLLERLTPKSLGKLIAIYEHKVFVEGVIWNINSFDQWGVELGKVLAKEIYKTLDGQKSAIEHDSSTEN